MSDRETNTTDATRGSSLRTRVESRKNELEAALLELAADDRSRPEIEVALSEINGLLTGDLDNIPRIVSAQMSSWLEANKHINERHLETHGDPVPVETEIEQPTP